MSSHDSIDSDTTDLVVGADLDMSDDMLARRRDAIQRLIARGEDPRAWARRLVRSRGLDSERSEVQADGTMTVAVIADPIPSIGWLAAYNGEDSPEQMLLNVIYGEPLVLSRVLTLLDEKTLPLAGERHGIRWQLVMQRADDGPAAGDAPSVFRCARIAPRDAAITEAVKRIEMGIAQANTTYIAAVDEVRDVLERRTERARRLLDAAAARSRRTRR